MLLYILGFVLKWIISLFWLKCLYIFIDKLFIGFVDKLCVILWFLVKLSL